VTVHSEVPGISVTNARQHAFRAHKRLSGERRTRPVDAIAHRRPVQAFLAAARSGNVVPLARLLAAYSRSESTPEPTPNGGGK
jgi:RNA polymerase sigma-70 factor (ECF subfamily)